MRITKTPFFAIIIGLQLSMLSITKKFSSWINMEIGLKKRKLASRKYRLENGRRFIGEKSLIIRIK
jgi:hypothetical protein